MKWFGRSLLHLILLLLAVSLVSFLPVSMSPVDPLQTNVGQTALGSMAPEQIEKLQAYWGVGVPVWKRFFSSWILWQLMCALMPAMIPCPPASS